MMKWVMCKNKTCCPVLSYDKNENIFYISDDFGSTIKVTREQIIDIGDTLHENFPNKEMMKKTLEGKEDAS